LDSDSVGEVFSWREAGRTGAANRKRELSLGGTKEGEARDLLGDT